jgi:hypothetical protein
LLVDWVIETLRPKQVALEVPVAFGCELVQQARRQIESFRAEGVSLQQFQRLPLLRRRDRFVLSIGSLKREHESDRRSLWSAVGSVPLW